jgi:hypothetical protein
MNPNEQQTVCSGSGESAPLYPAIQADNLRAVLAKIEAHPETWYQASWHCDTTHCFGGWAQILSGCEQTERAAQVRRDARRWLGLTRYEADLLFAGQNTLQRIRELVEQFTSPGAGYDRDGYDRAGYNRDGYDRAGYDRDGYDRAGYDRDGYDRDGYDEDGLDSQNRTAEEVARIGVSQ